MTLSKVTNHDVEEYNLQRFKIGPKLELSATLYREPKRGGDRLSGMTCIVEPIHGARFSALSGAYKVSAECLSPVLVGKKGKEAKNWLIKSGSKITRMMTRKSFGPALLEVQDGVPPTPDPDKSKRLKNYIRIHVSRNGQ